MEEKKGQKIKLIINPASSHGKAKKEWEKIKNQLENLNMKFDYAFTEKRGDAISIARESVQSEKETIIAIGGDGMINEVVNGMVNSDETIPKNLTLGVIPVGTGSDFARTMEIPRDYKEAVGRIYKKKTVEVDVGKVEYFDWASQERRVRYFINITDAAFSAEVCKAAQETWLAKFFSGTIPYVIGLLRTILLFKNKPVDLIVDDEKMKKDACLIAIANCRYFGGGMQIAPLANPYDGLLDVVILSDASKMEILKNLSKLYKLEGAPDLPNLMYKKAKKIEINSSEQIMVDIDGEVIGEGPLKFSLITSKLRVII